MSHEEILNNKNKKCNICGSEIFKLGWKGRLSSTGNNPTCAFCGSSERHRISHNLYQMLPEEWFTTAKLLMISEDKSVDTKLFSDVEISIFGGKNSIDIQDIEKPSEIYDWIICNHVLEHVENDRQAVGELLRILKSSGVFQFMVPSPLRVEKTNDWGYADPEICNHFRTYGKDLFLRFYSQLKGYKLFSYIGEDSVTNTSDIIYFVTKNEKLIKYFENNFNFIKEIEPAPFHFYTKTNLSLTTNSELSAWHKEYSEFVSFREEMIGYSEIDFMNSNLKLTQDLCMLNFIKKNIQSGAKVLEIGGGYSRILSYLKDKIEGWNLDKCEGIGNGPLNLPDDQGYIFLPAYIGSFDKNLPDASFDLVFSISVLEHINEDDEVLQNILNDIDRVLKPGGFSVHCIDCRFPPNTPPSIDNRRLAKFMIQNYGFSPQYVLDNHDNEDIFRMSGEAYDKFWKKSCHNRPHELDGLPFNIFLAAQKQKF